MAFYPPVTISNIIQKIEYQFLLLPAIQREFVWSHGEIEILFDSLMRDYPIGSLLLWKVNGKNKTTHRFYSILKKFREKYKTHCDEVNTSTVPDFEAVLDGQQRLTALYLGLKGSYAYKKPRVHWVNNEYALPTRKLYLKITEFAPQDDTEVNVSDDDGRLYDFKFLSADDLMSLNTEEWFEVGNILRLQGTFKLNSYIKENGWAENQFVNETLSKLHDMTHVNQIINYYLEDDPDYNKALNIFIRINSGGEPLDYSDLIMSTLIASWAEARKEINNLIDEIWDSYGFELNKDLILRIYLLIFSNDIKFRVSNFSLKNAKEFEKHWDEIRICIVTAFELIRDFGYTEQSLTSKNAVLPIAYYLFISKKATNYTRKEVAYKDDWEVIKKWFHAVLLHRIFGGQADAILKVIREPIKEAVEGKEPLFPAQAIATRLARTRKSITVDDEFIENLLYTRYEDRYAFPILALLFPHLDYKNNDFHKDHIHPKSGFTNSKLTKAGIVNSADDPDWCFTNKDYFNGIVNLQMLDGNQNISKGDKSLSDWASSSGLDLEKQMIPDILELEDFKGFVDARWKILESKLKSALSYDQGRIMPTLKHVNDSILDVATLAQKISIESSTKKQNEPTSFKLFDENDGLYQAWLKANPDGYVINSRRKIDPTYLVLHKATCHHVSRYTTSAPDGAFTERGYIKICSTELSSLQSWVKNHGRSDGTFSKECGSCNLASQSVKPMSTTHGGRKKGFGWRLAGNQIHIKNEDGRKHVFGLTETYQIIRWLNDKFGNDWFPLANNVASLSRGEEQDGLGVAILNQSPNDISHAQGSSYLGIVLEEVGVFQWNGEKRGIQWRIVRIPASVSELKERCGINTSNFT